MPRILERRFVVKATGWRLWRCWSFLAWCRRGTTTVTATAVVDELHVLSDDFELTTTVAFFVFPLVQLEATFHQAGTALGQVLTNELGSASPAFDIDERCLFLVLTTTVAEATVDCETKVGNGTVVGQ